MHLTRIAHKNGKLWFKEQETDQVRGAHPTSSGQGVRCNEASDGGKGGRGGRCRGRGRPLCLGIRICLRDHDFWSFSPILTDAFIQALIQLTIV